ncbi:TPA: saccharopine dehydrogenase NADP-binding domain-containing protein [Pseudomonas aeruginosa]|nr:saccharopine dehydrogenase NADP-binding domain-containing protein [Pseudomonas aeruginosa]
MKKLMIYGAAGYTGGMVAEHAASAGLDLVLAGRAQSRAALETLAQRLGAEARMFSLDDSDAIHRGLEGVCVLLNAAGPFMVTAEPLMAGAIRAGVHYLDFSAELGTYRQAMALDGQARAAGVMLLPGSGGSVAMLGSLAGHAVVRLKDPKKIRIALDVAGGMSRGSVTSATQNVVAETLHLVDGELVARSPEEPQVFDFGNGPQSSFPVTLPDLLTIHHATGVRDIETFVHVTAGAFPAGNVAELPAGPSPEERAGNRYHAAVEVIDADGAVARSVLDTVNGYTFTAMAAAEAARRVLCGELHHGFQTPAGVFGHGFAETIADTRIIDAATIEGDV